MLAVGATFAIKVVMMVVQQYIFHDVVAATVTPLNGIANPPLPGFSNFPI